MLVSHLDAILPKQRFNVKRKCRTCKAIFSYTRYGKATGKFKAFYYKNCKSAEAAKLKKMPQAEEHQMQIL